MSISVEPPCISSAILRLAGDCLVNKLAPLLAASCAASTVESIALIRLGFTALAPPIPVAASNASGIPPAIVAANGEPVA